MTEAEDFFRKNAERKREKERSTQSVVTYEPLRRIRLTRTDELGILDQREREGRRSMQ